MSADTPLTIAGNYDRLEAAIQEQIDNPGPILDETGENIAIDWDGNGQPLPNEQLRQEAQDLLKDLRKQRAEILGTSEAQQEDSRT